MRVKKTLAAILAAVMTVSAGLSAIAATPSPNTAPAAAESEDVNTGDHTGNTVTATVKDGKATVTEVTGKGDGAAVVNLKVARNSANEAVDITVIGDGKKGVFDSKAGRKVTTLKVSSKANVTVKKNAFKGSKVKTIKVKSKKVTINKNAFNGTKAKKITLNYQTKKASSLVLKKGALKGVTKVTVKGLNAKQYKKAVKALKAAGFTGTIKKG